MNPNGTNGHAEIATEGYRMVQVTNMDGLLNCWPFVKKGIDRIKARDKSCGSWDHHNIFNAIRFGLPTASPRTTAVELHLGVDSSSCMKGFVVTMPKIDPFRNNLPVGIVVWLLYADYRMIEMFLPSLEQLCRQHGGDEIEFQSGRLGWLRNFGRMKRLGFKVVQYKFSKTVEW